MFRRLARYAAAFGVVMAFACPVAAQYQQQQRTDDLGNMSAPLSGSAGPIQGAQPLPIPQTQSPTITNNPDYPRQPIFTPSPYVTPVPGQFPQQASPQTRTPQTTSPQTPASEQRGRGAF